MLEISEKDFKEFVLESPIPVLVDFWAPWCGPCRRLAPIIEEAAERFEGVARVYKVNVDDSPSLASEYKTVSVPTLMLFKGGQKVAQQTGAVGMDEIASIIEDNL